ncbi:hypothetical protein NE237_000672 [Protea cynaroides]|uniref:Uncharacterized protein n=1 Tax=Protea cynaroides TaxID=273540 RepID=A0A9Q0KRW5_9MAGN|nr:hypothetical protein NE237_000672 [Protea cynaroides]
MGTKDDFEAPLQVLWGFATAIYSEVNKFKKSVASSSKRNTVCCSGAKHRRYWFPSMIGTGLSVLQQASETNNVLFYSAIYEAPGVSSSRVTTCGLGAIQDIVTGITIWLFDKAGRRLLLIISSSEMTASFLLVAISIFIKVITMAVNLLLNWSSGDTFTLYTAVTAFSLAFVTPGVLESREKTFEEAQWPNFLSDDTLIMGARSLFDQCVSEIPSLGTQRAVGMQEIE